MVTVMEMVVCGIVDLSDFSLIIMFANLSPDSGEGS